jgi:hypothetical protein
MGAMHRKITAVHRSFIFGGANEKSFFLHAISLLFQHQHCRHYIASFMGYFHSSCSIQLISKVLGSPLPSAAAAC